MHNSEWNVHNYKLLLFLLELLLFYFSWHLHHQMSELSAFVYFLEGLFIIVPEYFWYTICSLLLLNRDFPWTFKYLSIQHVLFDYLKVFQNICCVISHHGYRRSFSNLCPYLLMVSLLQVLSCPEDAPPRETLVSILSKNLRMTVKAVGGQLNFVRSFHKISRLTVSNAFVKSMKPKFISFCCSLHFWELFKRATNIVSIVLGSGLKPRWNSGSWEDEKTAKNNACKNFAIYIKMRDSSAVTTVRSVAFSFVNANVAGIFPGLRILLVIQHVTLNALLFLTRVRIWRHTRARIMRGTGTE